MRWNGRAMPRMVVRCLEWSCDGWHGRAMAGMGVVQCQVVILDACPPGIDHSATARGDLGGSMNDLCPTDSDAIYRAWTGLDVQTAPASAAVSAHAWPCRGAWRWCSGTRWRLVESRHYQTSLPM